MRVSTLSCNKCSRDSAVYRINLRVRLSTVRRQRARMDKRPLLNLHPALYPFPHGLGRERCLVRVNDPFERSHLAQSRSSKLFFDTSSPKNRGRGNVSAVRVCRGTRCASIHRAAGHLHRVWAGFWDLDSFAGAEGPWGYWRNKPQTSRRRSRDTADEYRHFK